MPDIEKRTEAFVRIARYHHASGGVGTAEELLYLLGILMNQPIKNQVLPLILTGPKETPITSACWMSLLPIRWAKRPAVITASSLTCGGVLAATDEESDAASERRSPRYRRRL